MTPDEHTISERMLDVGDGHTLYVHDWGNKTASKPILFLHGGPGSGVKDKYKALFDGRQQRVIFFDQRGSGRSLPYGSLEHNTTQDLVADIETIRAELGLDSFIITGGSWGSCLALAYGLEHADRVMAMVLQGIFTGSQAEIDYLDRGGFAIHFPDVWDTFLDATPEQHHDDPSSYHVPRILGDDADASVESAYAYGNVEGALLSLDDRYSPPDHADYDPTFVRLEQHYLSQGCFLPDRFIIDNAHRLAMPVWLIQGRYDFVCPPVTAYELDSKLPDSRLIWTTAGHGNDRPNYDVRRTLLLQLSGER